MPDNETSSAKSPDVLVVAGSDDPLASAVAAEIEQRGRHVAFLDGMAAARLFSIRVTSTGTRVRPAVPMFLRASAWCMSLADDDDSRFLHEEAFATVWAAAHAMPGTVINRPTAKGSIGRLTSSAFIPAFGRGAELGEHHASDPALLRHLEGPVWGEDMEFQSADLSKRELSGPVRARTVNAAAEYETVAVVGDDAFCATDDRRSERANLREKSRAVVSSHHLHIATVLWALDRDTAIPVRLNAEPGPTDLRTCFGDVQNSIVRDLLR